MIAAAVLLFALAVAPFAIFRLYARRVAAANAPLEDRLHRLRRAQQVGLVALPMLAMIGFALTGLLDQAFGVFEGLDGPLGTAVSLFGIVAGSFALVVLPIASAVAGSYPIQRELRESTASIWRVLRGILVGIGVSAVAVLGWLGLVVALPDGVASSTAFLVVVFGLFVTVMFGLSPYLIAVFSKRVPLEGDRRERVEAICSELGYEPREIYLLEGESTQTANAVVAGTVPSHRYVFLTDYLLSEFDDDELRAVLAHEFGHVSKHHLLQRSLVTVFVFGAFMLAYEPLGLTGLADSYGFLGSFLPTMLGLFVYIYLILGPLSLRHEYQADAYAAAHAGPEATVAALDALAAANDARREASILWSLATQHPPVQDRIDAVRDSGRSRPGDADGKG